MSNIEKKSDHQRNNYPFPEIISSLCRNPRMFTLNGSFEEAISWIMGFSFGLSQSNPSMNTEWIDFQNWLPGRLNYPSSQSWGKSILELYPAESRAFEELSKLYEEFISSPSTVTEKSKT